METTDSTDEIRNPVRTYRCFLVRCGLEEGVGRSDEPGWRFSVLEAGDGAFRRSFAHLADVEAYLKAELGSPIIPVAGISQDCPNRGAAAP